MNLAERLKADIAKCRKSILVVGDRMVDRWIHGRLMPSQDGCDKFVQDFVEEVPGGAANARRTLSNWNVRATLHSYTRDVPIKCRYIADNKIVFRVDLERDSSKLTPDIAIAQNDVLVAIRTTNAVLLSDYDKGFLTKDFIRNVAVMCNQLNIPCVADCKRAPEVYNGCILKANNEWNEKYKHYADIFTRGSEQPHTKEFGLNGPHLPSVRCVNHVGAGDCFAAHLTLALAYGYSLRDAAAVAHSAGRVYVQHPHNRPPCPDEIAADLESIK